MADPTAKDIADVGARFWRKVAEPDDNGCRLWMGSRDRHGYGQFSLPRADGKQRVTGAHRFAWIEANGPVPGVLFVMHSCDVRHCVEPQHLALGTASENTRDMDAKGRRPLFLPRNRDPLIDAIRAAAPEIALLLRRHLEEA